MRRVKNTKTEMKKYHFIGIGGMGMGNLALLMLAKGFSVSGSDEKESELTRQLRQKGAAIFIGHDLQNIDGADCVVYSSAISASNPEMFEAVRLHKPILKRAELLAQLVNKEVGVTVAGAHGKTTTSSMASLLLINAGLKPTTAVGGVVSQGYNANLGIGRHIVAEVDESDGSFLYFSPHFSIITNIDCEHLDYYKTMDNVLAAYAKFVERTVPGGVVIACGDNQLLRGIVEQSARRHVFYGFGENNEWIATNIQCDTNGSSYDCYRQGKLVGRFSLTVPGKHNILNSLSVVVLGFELKIELSVIQETLQTFQGVKRRFERKGEVGGVLVVDDYGHHPTEIAATLQAARTLGRKRLVVAFQPHRYSRTQLLMNEFVECFNLADHLVLTDIYPASEKPIEGVTSEVLLEKIRAHRPQELAFLKKEGMVPYLLSIVQSGDLVLTLGAGDITGISDKLVRALEERAGIDHIPAARLRSREEIKALGTIGVVMGGCSSEREVSLRSGSAVVKSLTEAGCRVKALDLTTEDRELVKGWFRSEKIEVAFIALHGRFGEDGGLQSILDEMEIPYQGCGASASYAAFNKAVAQKQFEDKGVRTPRTLAIKGSAELSVDDVVKAIGLFPMVVKPACEGSSIGVSLAENEQALREAVVKAEAFGRDIIIQEFIRGRELTVGIIGQSALPIVEIRVESSPMFDISAKYEKNTTQYIVPAMIVEAVGGAVQAEALKAYRALHCEGFGRVDVLLDANNIPFVLEINTIPGFTATSLLPKAARAAGLDFQQLCLTLVEMAYGKKKAESISHQY
ncbi:MAG: UDP-N-acetylmuramate--L-alanine ligase [Candidatus Omnitrophica bacterium]|nr:UDP-N-acetylmuramate--L-alanine ligase [Candidatus Omnitrophota bacterium]